VRPNTISTLKLLSSERIKDLGAYVGIELILELVEPLAGGLTAARIHHHQVVEVAIGLSALAIAINVIGIPTVKLLPIELRVREAYLSEHLLN
jgi:hypothetical protein